jgi:DNA-binding NarL/FixJ family response regulator
VSAQPRVRLAIIDDHPIFCDALKSFLETIPSIEVVAVGHKDIDAPRIVAEHKPDVLLLDYALPESNGLGVLKRIPIDRPRVILLTADMKSGDIVSAIQLGARGVVFKHAATQTLIDAIFRVMDGGFVLSDDLVGDLAHAIADGTPEARFKLTPREAEVLRGVCDGASNADIARNLGISTQTVKHHLTSIFTKTDTSSRLALALFALEHGLG